jgi:DNA mismatch repair ATPase MutS
MDDELDKFKKILSYLENYPYGHHENIKQFCNPFVNPNNPPTKQLKRIKYTTSAIGLRSNPIMGLLLNLVFPWDTFFALQINNCREQLINILPVWLNKWSELEALISLSNFAHLNPNYCFPEIAENILLDGNEGNIILNANNLGHPLIPQVEKICNDFKVRTLGEITIITGSNMAGKSTFVKTLGVNLCLAYAGGPVNASNFRSIPFRLHTCIKISDSLTDGFSYFYSEVKCLKALLNKMNSDDQYPLLYLVDEIFRGTNNQERLIGSQAYIQNLVGKNGVGVIATHDLELANLANNNNSIYNYHFKDEVLDGKLVFDYLIRPGPSPTTNALKIMKLEGLPINPE